MQPIQARRRLPLQMSLALQVQTLVKSILATQEGGSPSVIIENSVDRSSQLSLHPGDSQVAALLKSKY